LENEEANKAKDLKRLTKIIKKNFVGSEAFYKNN